MRRFLGWAAISLFVCAQAMGGVLSSSLPRAGENEGLSFAGVPDLQNYCSAWDPTADVQPPGVPLFNRAEGIRQLRALANDIVAERPEFVIQVGDWTDTTGGADQGNGTWGQTDDPDTFTTRRDRYVGEWQCVLDNFVRIIEAAGIPMLGVLGNHDSCVDHERAFPVAAFRLASYYFSDSSRASRCGGSFTDTVQRAALFSTSIGNICAVAIRSAEDDDDATDIAYVNGAVGCGGSWPTIDVRHASESSADYQGVANSENFLTMGGHIVPLGLQTSIFVTAGGHEVADVVQDWQEQSLNCQQPVAGGSGMHTGVGWWVKYRLVPRTSQLYVQARSPLFGGDAANPCSYPGTQANAVLTYSPTLCSRFPTLKGC